MLIVNGSKITGTRWAKLVNVHPRRAQYWLSGHTPAPAWAVYELVTGMGIETLEQPLVAFKLLRELSERRGGT